MTDPQRLDVSGGTGGVAARYDDMEDAGRLIDDVSAALLGMSASLHGLLLSPDVLASALLDPVGAARFEVALLTALDGPEGLTATGGAIGVRAVQLRLAVATYRTTDQLQADLLAARRFLQGALAAAALPVLPALVAVTAAAWYGSERLAGREPDLERLLTDHPGIVDEVVGSAPGFVSGLSGDVLGAGGGVAFWFVTGKSPFPTTVAEGAGLLGLLYPDGRPVVRNLGVDESLDVAKPPRGVADLMKALSYRDEKASGSGQGQIDVRVVEQTLPDGTVRRGFVVDIPGTKNWQVDPRSDRRHVTDLGTNLHALAGEETTYERGVAEALRRAGATPQDPVMLVGHSQGGMVAVQAADHFVSSGRYQVTHVVTAGSPVGAMTVPPSVQVLSVENEHDIIPHLDARPNRDAANWTTVTYDAQLGSVGANHDMGRSYVPAAEAVDASTDPSVRAFRDSAGTFFEGQRVQSSVYQVTREPT